MARDVVLHLNLARTNPAGYATTYLAPRRVLFRGRAYINPLDPNQQFMTMEGLSAVEEAVGEMKNNTGMETLEVSDALLRSAADHAVYLSSNNETGHNGKGGETPFDRIERQGKFKAIGEVLAFGNMTGQEAVSRLLIDDGVQTRGHRQNILNPGFRYVGVSIKPHPQYGQVIVIDFAAERTAGD